MRSSFIHPMLVIIALVGLSGPWSPAVGQDAPRDPRGVAVSGVPDTFDALRDSIAAIREKTRRQYRVIVLADGGGRAPSELLESILERWWREAAEGTAAGLGAGYDPTRDVTILVDQAGRGIAMKVPAELENAAGLDERTIEAELIGKVFGAKARDGAVAEGLEDLIAATEYQVRSREERRQAKARAEVVFRTRTLPLMLIGSAAALGLAALATQWLRHRRMQRSARGKLATFKAEVVALSDLLDGQQERHRMLPHSDPDFSTPMEGQTRVVYDGVQESIGRYRERWLGLMDVWERADARMKDEWWLGTAASQEVIELLDSAESRPPLDDVAGACRAPLDQLEMAHETSRDLVKRLETMVAAAGERVGTLAARGRSGASFQPGLVDGGRSLEAGRHAVEADPVLARGRLEGAITALEEQGRRLDAFEAADDRRRGAAAAIEAAEARVRGRRAEGWLLTEPGADPSTHLVRAREQEQVAAGLLDAGEVEAAVSHLDAADRAVAEALALLESVAAARARFDELLPAVVARLEGVREGRGTAVKALDWLAGLAAPASWDDIADNVSKADEGVSRGRAMIAEGREAADPSRQHLFRAVALLEEAARQIDWAAGCQDAVLQREAAIAGLVDTLPGRIDEVGGRLDSLTTRLERQRTDRTRANEHCREAGRLVETAARAVRVDRPDYPRTAQVLDAAELTMARGTELADEDERLARQAAAELEEADGLMRRVAAWYGEGLSADLGEARRSYDAARGFLQQQRYEDSIAASAEAARQAREAYAAVTAEAQRRRQRRQLEMQRRQMEDSFVRMSRGSGPWVIQLPGGPLAGPNPWGPVHPGMTPGRSRAAPSDGGATGAGRWSSGTAEGHW
jgi:hypothetical protein